MLILSLIILSVSSSPCFCLVFCFFLDLETDENTSFYILNVGQPPSVVNQSHSLQRHGGPHPAQFIATSSSLQAHHKAYEPSYEPQDSKYTPTGMGGGGNGPPKAFECPSIQITSISPSCQQEMEVSDDEMRAKGPDGDYHNRPLSRDHLYLPLDHSYRDSSLSPSPCSSLSSRSWFSDASSCESVSHVFDDVDSELNEAAARFTLGSPLTLAWLLSAGWTTGGNVATAAPPSSLNLHSLPFSFAWPLSLAPPVALPLAPYQHHRWELAEPSLTLTALFTSDVALREETPLQRWYMLPGLFIAPSLPNCYARPLAQGECDRRHLDRKPVYGCIPFPVLSLWCWHPLQDKEDLPRLYSSNPVRKGRPGHGWLRECVSFAWLTSWGWHAWIKEGWIWRAVSFCPISLHVEQTQTRTHTYFQVNSLLCFEVTSE